MPQLSKTISAPHCRMNHPRPEPLHRHAYPVFVGLMALLTLTLALPAASQAADKPAESDDAAKPVTAAPESPEKPPLPMIDHVIREIEGWQVHVDRRLLEGEGAETGKQALRVLSNCLFRVALVVPEDRLARLREVPVWIDLDHPLGNLQYHPSIDWLREHGHDPAMARSVHIPRAARLIRLQVDNSQPWVMLHELAHAYHDRVLGFDEKMIRDAFDKAVESKLYEKVLQISGRRVRHYALTNHKEYFAEMTEAYFATNDFYPFVRAELSEYDPETHRLLQAIWREPRKVTTSQAP